ncbi:MAG: DCC1-like thiol-disulfide oxidoreductase family protein [Planctomycetota bacterium]
MIMTAVVERSELDLAQHPIVFFDGVCGLCDHTVKLLLRLDRRQRLRFAPLQGETAAQLLEAADIQELKSLVMYDRQGVSRCSTAVVRILWHVGGLYRIPSSLLWLIPSPIRNWGYRFVAAHRYQWFGKHEACRLPVPSERARFLP